MSSSRLVLVAASVVVLLAAAGGVGGAVSPAVPPSAEYPSVSCPDPDEPRKVWIDGAWFCTSMPLEYPSVVPGGEGLEVLSGSGESVCDAEAARGDSGKGASCVTTTTEVPATSSTTTTAAPTTSTTSSVPPSTTTVPPVPVAPSATPTPGTPSFTG